MIKSKVIGNVERDKGETTMDSNYHTQRPDTVTIIGFRLRDI